jgi:hypothetical protein
MNQEYLKSILHYDPITGDFTWIENFCKKAKVGKKAGTIENSGYLVIGINNKKYKAHRLAFLYMLGEFPNGVVDHKDGIKINNTWGNLRACNEMLNGQNQYVAHKNNPTGLLGVTAVNGKFRSKITVNKKQITIGYFSTAKEAHEKYLAEKRQSHSYGNL